MAAGLVAVGVTAGALAGCTSGDDPTPTPTPTASSTSASPSPTPTPSPTETSTIPAAAREKSEKGAEAFVRYFFDQVNVAWTEPKPGAVAAISDTECTFCSSVEKLAVGLDKEGQKYATAPVTLTQVEPFVGGPEGQVYLSVGVTQNRANIVDRSGRVVATDGRKTLQRNVAVLWTGAEWRMFEVEKAA